MKADTEKELLNKSLYDRMAVELGIKSLRGKAGILLTNQMQFDK